MINRIKIPFRVGYKLYFLSVFYAILVVSYPIFKILLLKEEWWPKAFKLIRFWSYIIRFATGIRVRYPENRHFPKPPYVIVANHASYIDIFLMYAIVPDFFSFMGKGELKNWPIFRIFFTSGMNILVERASIKASHKAYKDAQEKLEKGICVAIFPEGGIMPTAPQLSRFKNGAFKMAIDKQVPIVPITILNSYEIFESNDLYKGYGGPDVARIVVHKAVETEGKTEEDLVHLRQHCYSIIKDTLVEYGSK